MKEKIADGTIRLIRALVLGWPFGSWQHSFDAGVFMFFVVLYLQEYHPHFSFNISGTIDQKGEVKSEN